MNVFDFDNTIYDGESALDFFLYYLKRDPLLVKYAPQVFHALYKYKKGRVSIEQAINAYGEQVGEYFKNMNNVEEVVAEFWDKHEKNIKPFYREIQRDDDLVISGSPEFSLGEICKRLEINRYIGSVIDRETGEFLRFCFRENKVKAFREIYGEIEIENFYTDSLHDMPLIEISKNAYIVKGSKIEKIK